MSYKLVDMVFDLDLPAGEKQVLSVLARHAWDDGTESRPSVKKISRLCGQGTTRVREHLRGLESKRIIERTRTGGGRWNGRAARSNEWTLHIERAPRLVVENEHTQHSGVGLTSSTSEHTQQTGVGGTQRTGVDQSVQGICPDQVLKELGIHTRFPKKRNSRKKPLPEHFEISDSVRTWAAENGYGDLDLHLEVFVSWARAHGRCTRDWDFLFKKAIEQGWADNYIARTPQ